MLRHGEVMRMKRNDLDEHALDTYVGMFIYIVRLFMYIPI